MTYDKLDLEIVTPDRLVFSETVDEVVLPGIEGYFGVLPGHAPFLSALAPGEVTVRVGGRSRFLSVSGGFVEVLRDRVSVLAEACERAEEIDLERAQQDRDGAENAIRNESSEAKLRRAQERLAKATARIQVQRRARPS